MDVMVRSQARAEYLAQFFEQLRWGLQAANSPGSQKGRIHEDS